MIVCTGSDMEVMQMNGITGVSPSLSSINTSSLYGVAMLSKSLDTQEQSGHSMVKMMEQFVNPSVGGNFDASC